MLYVADLRERRERTFLVLAGFFLCAMTLLNVIGDVFALVGGMLTAKLPSPAGPLTNGAATIVFSVVRESKKRLAGPCPVEDTKISMATSSGPRRSTH